MGYPPYPSLRVASEIPPRPLRLSECRAPLPASTATLREVMQGLFPCVSLLTFGHSPWQPAVLSLNSLGTITTALVYRIPSSELHRPLGGRVGASPLPIVNRSSLDHRHIMGCFSIISVAIISKVIDNVKSFLKVFFMATLRALREYSEDIGVDQPWHSHNTK